MKAAAFFILCLLTAMDGIVGLPVAALDAPDEPRITLSVNNQPLGDVLDTIASETGYRFNLNDRWSDYPVSAVIRDLPLEQGLKRLLRSLNHTIVWEADNVVTIVVVSKVDPAGKDSGVSFGLPPNEAVEAPEPDETIEAPAAEASDPSETAAPGSEAQEGVPAAAGQDTGAEETPTDASSIRE